MLYLLSHKTIITLCFCCQEPSKLEKRHNILKIPRKLINYSSSKKKSNNIIIKQ